METIVNVLDHGYVKLLNIAGPTRRVDAEFDADDVDPANSARMSFDQRDSGRTREQDIKLTEYLIKNRHTTPIEQIVIWLEMKLPIFVARQLIRHRTVSVNEVSARYTTLPEEWYLPPIEQVKTKPTNNKQGRGEDRYQAAHWFVKQLDDTCRHAYIQYTQFIEDGVAPEIARNFLHVNHYTKWLWRQDLHNMMHFLSLRDHSHAQWEAQEYARAIDKLIRQVLPETMSLYDKYRKQKNG